MTGEDDVPTLRIELRPHAQAHLVGLPAKQLRVDRPHEGAHAIETFGLGAGRQPFEVTVRTRDVAVRAGSDVDDDVSALRHEYGSPLANCEEQFDRLSRLTTRFRRARFARRLQRVVGRDLPWETLMCLIWTDAHHRGRPKNKT